MRDFGRALLAFSVLATNRMTLARNFMVAVSGLRSNIRAVMTDADLRSLGRGPCLFPDGPVNFLVERRAAGGELAHVVVLRSHEGRAIAERPAQPLAVERLAVAAAAVRNRAGSSAPRPIPTNVVRSAATFAAPASNA